MKFSQQWSWTHLKSSVQWKPLSFFTLRISPQYVCTNTENLTQPTLTWLFCHLPLMASKQPIDCLDKSCNALLANITSAAAVGKSFILNLTLRETPFPSNSLTEAKDAWAHTAGSSQGTEHAEIFHIIPKTYFPFLQPSTQTHHETVTGTQYCQLVHNYWFFFPA